MITVAAHAADGAANRRSASRRRALCSAMNAAPPEHDDAREEAVRVEAHELRAQAREEPEIGERAPVKSADGALGDRRRAAAPAERARRRA